MKIESYFLWKFWYNFIAKTMEINTMNYGYYPITLLDKESVPFPLVRETDLYSLSLYNFISQNLGNKVLEIGCGRGGGLYFLAKKQPDIFAAIFNVEQMIQKRCLN